jgi:hypothetical protein
VVRESVDVVSESEWCRDNLIQDQYGVSNLLLDCKESTISEVFMKSQKVFEEPELVICILEEF